MSIDISKKYGIKNCVRINGKDDIPDFLRDVIKVDGESLVLDCLEGEERCPLGSVIAFEKLASGKMNVWNKANYKETTLEIDGVFYEKPHKNTAIRITEMVPQNIADSLGDKLSVLPNGDIQIDTGWNLSRLTPGNGYLVVYGEKPDGSLDVNFLTKGTPSYYEYDHVDEKCNPIETLPEYDAQFYQEQSTDKKI